MGALRVAAFHNLPPGGAYRWFVECTLRSAHRIDWLVHSIDLGPMNRWPIDAREHAVRDASESYQRHRLPLPRLSARLGSAGQVLATELSIRLQRRIATAIDEQEPDLVVVHHDQYTSSPAVLPGLRTPTVYVCQEPRRRSFDFWAASTYRAGPLTLPWKLYETRLRRADIRWARSADVIVANSLFSMEAISRSYGRDPHIHRLGVDLDTFTQGTARSKRSQTFVLCVGSIDRTKGQDLVVAALAQIPAGQRPELHLVYERADPRFAREVQETAARWGVNVVLHRGISDGELAQLYTGAAATICAARLEPFGLTPLESLACGTPVVAVNEGGYRETVRAENGHLVPRDPRAMAKAIQALVQEPDASYPALRATVDPQFGWTHSVERFCDQLHEWADSTTEDVDR